MYCLLPTVEPNCLARSPERRGVLPFGHVGPEILQLAVVGVEAHPAFRHLDDVGRVAGLHHGQEFLEGLAPGQRDEFDLDARIGRLRTRRSASSGIRCAAGW